MNNKKWKVGGGAVFGVAVVVLMVIPASRYFILGTLRNEPRREGKFMSEWMNLLGSESAEVRQEATSALCRMNGDARPSVPALLDVMANDPVDHVRSGAAFAFYMISSDLKQRGTPATEAVPALAAALRDPH